jgi:hypothetical protein
MRNFQDDIAAYVGGSTCLPPFHPLANNFPMIDADSLKALTDNIKEHGLLEPIVMYEGMILDGRNRVRACFAAGFKLEPKHFVEFRPTPTMSALDFVFGKNLHRRHLSKGQRAMLADDMATARHGGDHESELSRADAAKLWCVSLDSVNGAAFIKNHASPKVIAKVRAGSMTIWRGRCLAKESDEDQWAAPDVKFGGERARLKPPGTAPSARAWLKMDDDAKLRFRDSVVEPWFREHMARQSTNGGP